MAGHSADVTIGYTAKVVGRGDVDKLADSLDDVDKATPSGPLDVKARVTGAGDVDKLDKALDKLPASTDVTVDLAVDPLRPVTDVKDAVDALADGKVSVTLDVTGDDIDTVKTDLAALPATTTVALNVDADTAGIGTVKTAFDDVKGAASEASGEAAAFGSEITGTLGGQFSEGTGMVGDFAEKFGALKTAIGEADDKRKTLGLAVAGIGGTLLAGFGLDAILGVFEQISQAAETTKANIKTLADQIVTSGGLIDAQFQKTQVQQIVEDPGFSALIAAGADYQDTLDGLRGDTEALARVHGELATKAQAAAEGIRQAGGSEEQAQAQFQTVQTLDDLAGKFDAAGDSAIKSGRDLQNYLVHAGLAEDKVGAAANGVDLLSAAMQTNAKDTDKSADKLRDWNSTDLEDKDATISATDKATGKVTTYNSLKVNEKTGTLSAIDTATGKVHTYNSLNVNAKTGTLSAIDNATGKVTTFNLTSLNDKTATVDADTAPAKADIDELNGRSVTIGVNAHIQNLTPAQQRRLFGETFSLPAPPPGDLEGTTPPGLLPTVRTAAAGTGGPVATVPVVIEIKGTVIDPAGAARALQQVLTRAHRRTGTLAVGGRFEGSMV